MMLYDYNLAFYTIEDIQKAEIITKAIIGHSDIEARLNFMIQRKMQKIRWFDLTDCERDLIRDYSQIPPRFPEGPNQAGIIL